MPKHENYICEHQQKQVQDKKQELKITCAEIIDLNIQLNSCNESIQSYRIECENNTTAYNDISMKKAKTLIDTYFETYPGIRRYMVETIDKAKKNGFVETLYNRRRSAINLNASNANIVNAEKRAAINMPIIKLYLTFIEDEFAFIT